MPQILVGSLAATAAVGSATSFFATVAGRLLTSVAIGALQYGIAKMQAKASESGGGIVTEQTLSGGTNPVFFQMGKYATSGMMYGPELTHDDDKYLTYVVVISALAGTQLSRLMINNAYATVSETSPHADYGKRIVGTYIASSEEITGVDADGSPVVTDVIDNYAWIKWYDGTQTTADAMMLSKYGSHPTWPWSSDMIGRDLTYAILTFRAKSSIFSAKPTVKFEVLGIPLYDPSKDTTAGGSGSQRWATPSTWTSSDNPMVHAYNVMRGVTILPGRVYGGQSELNDLPLDLWIEAIAKCHLDDGAGSPTYRCGIEVFVSDEPASVLEEIAKSCAAEFADVGGVWEVQVGDPPLPEYFFSDDDVIITQDQTTDLFSGDLTGSVFNAALATYPEPMLGWARKDSPIVEFSDFQEQDLGKPLVASMTLSTVPYPDQAQRLCSIYVKDSRKTRQHHHGLPPAAAFLSPMRTVSFTSNENGYAGKLFKISQIADDILSMVQAVSLVEVDPTDYDFDPGNAIPITTPSVVPPPTSSLNIIGFSANAFVLNDGDAVSRKSTIRLAWSTSNLSDRVTSTEWRMRLTGSTLIMLNNSTTTSTLGFAVETAVSPAVEYDVQARHSTKDGKGPWSAWVGVTTVDVKIIKDEIDTVFVLEVENAQADADAAAAAAAAVTANHNALVAGFTGGTLAAAFDAAAQMVIAAREGWVADPIFADWSATTTLNADNWFAGGNPSFQSRIADSGGVYVNIPAGNSANAHFVAGVLSNDGLVGANTNAPFVTLSLEFEMVAGSLSGQRFYPEWSIDGTTWVGGLRNGVSNTPTFADRGVQVIPGVKQFIQEIWSKPAGTFTHMRLIFAAKWVGSSDVLTQVKGLLAQVRASAQAEIDAYKTYSVATATNGATSTVQGIGAAMAQVSTSLNAQVGSTNADLSTNYLTSASTTAAIAATETTLRASIGRGDSAIHQYLLEGWSYVGSPVLTTVPEGKSARFDVAAGTDAYMAINSNHAAWKGAKDAAAFRIEVEFILTTGSLSGASVRVDWDTAGTEFVTPMSLTDMMQGSVRTGVPQVASGVFARPAGFTGVFAKNEVYVFANYSAYGGTKTAKNIEITRVSVYAADSTDALSLTLDASVSDILAVDVSALTGTAMGVLLTQLAVSGGGTSATVTAQGSAIAALDGNASALYGFYVGAGGASAGLELCAYYDADAGVTATNVRINADYIDLVGKVRASSLLISSVENAFPDFDMIDTQFYTTSTAAGHTFIATTANNLGSNFLNIPVSAALEIVDTLKFKIEPSQTYQVNGGAWLAATGAGQGQAVLELQTLAQDGVTVERTLSVRNTTDLALGSISFTPVTVIMTATERWARFRMRRSAGGTGSARFGGFKAKQMTGADLLVSGSIFGYHLDVSSAIITGSVQMGNATVETLTVAGNAITVPVRAEQGGVSFSSTSTWTELIRLTIDAKGESTAFSGSLRFGLENDGYIALELRQGSRVVWTAHQVSGANGGQSSMPLIFCDNQKITGSTGYKLFGRKLESNGGRCDVYKTYLNAIQYRR